MGIKVKGESFQSFRHLYPNCADIFTAHFTLLRFRGIKFINYLYSMAIAMIIFLIWDNHDRIIFFKQILISLKNVQNFSSYVVFLLAVLFCLCASCTATG